MLIHLVYKDVINVKVQIINDNEISRLLYR